MLNPFKKNESGESTGTSHSRPEFIEVGQIVNTHGVRGEMKLLPLGFDADFVTGFKTLYIDSIAVKPTAMRIHKDCVLLTLPDVEDMDTANSYRGKFVSIRRTDAHLPKGEYFDAELIGMEVYNFFPRRLVGTLTEVLSYPAHKLYRVRGKDHSYLIPAVQDIFIVDILPDEGQIFVHMMEGLETDEN